MAGDFTLPGAALTDVAAPKGSIVALVASGELWMDHGVAERAATRCEQICDEIDDLLVQAKQLTYKRAFGDNADGHAAAERFVQAGWDYINTMQKAQKVFLNMAATYRAAGRTVSEAEAANERMFRGGSQ
jgi:hypothetical protein